MWIIKKLYAIWLSLLELLLGIDLAKKFDTKFRFHKSLNLKNPHFKITPSKYSSRNFSSSKHHKTYSSMYTMQPLLQASHHTYGINHNDS